MKLFPDTSAFPAHLRRARPVESGMGTPCEQPEESALRQREERIAKIQGQLREQRMLARMKRDLDAADRMRFNMNGPPVGRPEHAVVLVPPPPDEEWPTDYASAYAWAWRRRRYMPREYGPQRVDLPDEIVIEAPHGTLRFRHPRALPRS